MAAILNDVTEYLLQQSWQIALVFVLVAVGCRLLKNATAHWRYLLWCVVLAKCLMPPMVTLSLDVLPHQTSGFVENLSLAATTTEQEIVEPVDGIAPQNMPTDLKAGTADNQSARQESVPAPYNLKAWLGLGWLVTAGLLLAVMFGKGLRLHRYLKKERQPLNATLEDELKTLQEQLHLKQRPSIWEVDGFGQPFVWGVLRGAVYIPRDFGETVAKEHRRGIWVHEMAHVSRWDAAVNALQIVVQAIFFFHPLVWWANKKIRQEREKCCDETAIALLNAAPREYGNAILENLIAENKARQPVPTLAIASPVKHIEERIRTIMSPRRQFFRKPTWLVIATTLLFAALAGPTALVLGVRAQEATVTEKNSLTNESKAFVSKIVKTVSENLAEKVIGNRPRGNCSISGKVVSAETGKPVDHGKVYLFYSGTHAAMFFDVRSDGSFEFKDIPAGLYTLRSIKTEGYQDAVYNPENHTRKSSFIPFSLKKEEQRTDVVLKVKPAYSVSGTVFDKNDKILKDNSLSVVAWRELDEVQGNLNRYKIAKQSRITTDGTYRLDGLDDSPVYIMVIDWQAGEKDDYYPPCYYPGTVARNEAKKITFENTKSVDNIDIYLKKKGEFILEGVVKDATTSKAIPQALVTVHHRDMLFDRLTTYTDEEGRYRIESLGAGDFLVHVDAEPWGYVRARNPIKIEKANINKLDFSLNLAAKISGKFVDEDGQPVEINSRSYGLAFRKGYATPETASWSGARNRYGKRGRARENTFNGGQGDYQEEYMDFPTSSTFVVEGIIPGETILRFHPLAQGESVKEILHDGKNVMQTGIETKPAEETKDVTIVIGTQ